MILIFEQDTRKHAGRRFTWCPGLYRGRFMGRRNWRAWWGLWSLSYYSAPGLKEFFDHVGEGNVTWVE